MSKIRTSLASIYHRISNKKVTNIAYIKKYKKYSFSDVKCNSIEGYEAIITRFYHTIEKGLSYVDYRAGFGKNNITALISAMNNYISDGYPNDTDFYRTALSVLIEYYQKNKEYGLDDQELNRLINSFPGEKNSFGGIIYFDKPSDTKNQNFKQLMQSRHSIRHFSNVPVDIEIIKEAIQIAQYTPSACNRQGWRTRIISNKAVVRKVLSNQNGNAGFGEEIDKLLIITSDLRYFNSDRETYQAFIDGGMYAESVINSLYYCGVGSIPLSASLTEKQETNIREIVKLEDSEILILFIGVGNYLDRNQTTRSERKKVNPVVI